LLPINNIIKINDVNKKNRINCPANVRGGSSYAGSNNVTKKLVTVFDVT